MWSRVTKQARDRMVINTRRRRVITAGDLQRRAGNMLSTITGDEVGLRPQSSRVEASSGFCEHQTGETLLAE